MDKSENVATEHYFNKSYYRALVNVQTTNMGPQVRPSDNITMDPQQVAHLPLALPYAATETHVFVALQNASLISVGQLCSDVC